MDIKTAEQCAEYIKDKINGFKPTVGVVLGSGLGEVFSQYKPEAIVEYSEIPQFPTATVSGHKGRFLFFNLNGKNVMVMQGRVHFYEGYSISQAVLPIAVMKILGVQSLILTNASGGINPSFNPGDIMVITDHISSFVPSPLIGKNNDEYGTRFPDMSNVYNSELADIIYKIADEMDIRLKKGVYVQATGPNYETPAEVRMFGILGADAVGMSTVCEAMAANYLGMSICGFSLVTNKAVGLTSKPLNHKEVERVAGISAQKLGILIPELIARI